jgi:hypothetical protein
MKLLFILGVVAALIVVLLCPRAASAAVICHSRKGDDSGWSWRLIDGRKCWYRGRHRLHKTQLHWPNLRPLRPPTPAAAAPRLISVIETANPLDMCCWPPPANLSRCCWPPGDFK